MSCIDVRFEPNRFGFERGPQGLDRSEDDIRDIDRPRLEPQLAADRTRHVEEIVDQPRLRPRVPLDRGNRPAPLVAAQTLGGQHADPPIDGGQRRAQLVRDRHQEFILQIARRFCLEPRTLFALECLFEAFVGLPQPFSLEPLHFREVLFRLAPCAHLPEQHAQHQRQRQRERRECRERRLHLPLPVGQNLSLVQGDGHDQGWCTCRHPVGTHECRPARL